MKKYIKDSLKKMAYKYMHYFLLLDKTLRICNVDENSVQNPLTSLLRYFTSFDLLLNVSLDFINHTQLGTQLQAFSYSHEIIS
jgi:hypothetical protein